MSQGRAQIRRGVQDVRANDEVERSFVESLLERFAIQIQGLIFDLGEGSQFLLGRRKERARSIGEDVAMQLALETRKDISSQAARARADFENAQTAALG